MPDFSFQDVLAIYRRPLPQAFALQPGGGFSYNPLLLFIGFDARDK
jgi:hypothetical protein